MSAQPPPPPPTQPPPPPTPPPPGRYPPGQTQVAPGYATYQKPLSPAARFGNISSFWQRLGGHLLDNLIYGLIAAVLLIPGIVLLIGSFADLDCVDTVDGTSCDGDLRAGPFAGGILLFVLGGLLSAALYLWQLSRTGQTFGRRIVGIKVIDVHSGEAPGFGKALGRSLFAWFISGQIFAIGYLWMLWDDQQQTLHDKVAGTHVIDV